MLLKKKIEQENFLNEIIVKDAGIKKEITGVLDRKGCVYGLAKKGVLKAVYIFDKITDENKNLLKFYKSIFLDEVENKKKEFEDAIIEDLKEKVALEQIEKVDWEDIEIEPNTMEGFSGISLSLGISLGLLYGVILKNISIGILMGISIGLMFGAVVKRKK